ncbi:hypothetical protein RSSM_06031 [Rhodopirellula sallentina SM41]|uniref:Uncharacterized protein n=1 Tax=Rhodopirellula sallentina SM41 TaxID=1263870 RepID=M5U3T7_9BACT|nr:hypothetical protein RSSM_06031 [Rhodopirellula sallentina SM41]
MATLLVGVDRIVAAFVWLALTVLIDPMFIEVSFQWPPISD